MTHAQVVNLIRTVANTVNPNGFFIYAKEDVATNEYDQEQWPQIHLNSVRSRPDRIAGVIRHDILMCFIDQDDPASNPDSSGTDDPAIENQESIINRMWDLEDNFMNSLFNTPVQFASELMKPDYRKYMATATGYWVTFTIETKYRKC